jgi:ABC-type amino acid transport substrate-binding protein
MKLILNNMSKYVIIAILVIAAILLIANSFIFKSGGSPLSSQSLDEKVISSGEIRVGYIIYPPLLMKDEATGKLTGISYDLVEEAAKKLNLKTNWVEEVGWGTAIEGLKTRRYDILGTQMWPNSSRAREAIFSVAPMNSNIYAYTKAGDNRFTNGLTGLNSPEYTISALDGEMSSIVAKEDYPQAKTNTLPQTGSMSEVLLNMTGGKADITFIEPSVANDFLKQNPGKIERVGDTPVRTFGNSFAFARGEDSMVNMWNIAIGELINNGTVDRTLEKYNVASDYTMSR